MGTESSTVKYLKNYSSAEGTRGISVSINSSRH